MWVIKTEKTSKIFADISTSKVQNKTQFRVLRTRKIQHSSDSIPAGCAAPKLKRYRCSSRPYACKYFMPAKSALSARAEISMKMVRENDPLKNSSERL